MLLAFIASTVTYAQIPGPQYNNYKYQDSTNFKRPHKHGNKLQPKVFFGLGQFNFNGDITDTRNNGLIGRTGMQFGLSANINDFFDANLIIEEGIVRVEGTNQEDLPDNFMSTLNTIGLRFAYNFKNIFKNTKINPFATAGLTYMKFDSKGTSDASNDLYEIDLLDEYLNDNGERYSQNSFTLPLGIGLSLAINDRMNFNLSTVMHLTGTDYIDNIVNGSNDAFTVTSASFIYDIFCYTCEEKYEPEYHDDYLANVNFKVLDKEDSDRDGVIDIDDFCPKITSN